jgi:hypothetical protein
MPRQHENDPNMNRGEVHDISLKLGQLSQAVEMMTDMWQRQEEAATAGRRALHEKFESFRDDVGLQIAGLSLRIDRLTDQVKTIEPSVTAFQTKMKDDREDELLSEGARRFRVKVGVWITAGAGAVGWGLHELIGYIRH